MSVRTMNPVAQTPVDWLRIGGLSGTLSVHVLAVVLLAIPIALPSLDPVQEDLTTLSTSLIEIPPESEPIALPDEPRPQPVARHRTVSIAPSSPAPVVAVDSVMATPERPAVEADATTIEPATDLGNGSATAHVGLAYESIVQPKYPLDARRRGEQGTVVLRVLVGRDGLPVEVDIARSSGSRQLDRAAREAVLRSRFRPVRIDGIAVPARGLVPIEFSIERG
ncbi:energy transducer TonB [Dokdonella immobilis]|uniref:Outer membrane transport energization protein TonB n=1 Tax=Dokdonella immobilis TaxID=578942 RepID=A0A1I4Z1B2_9GAMM|nr:energy transducer TonB [Dokdonella immobilis]SFN43843.1 outer membrane transport energization protein TonB [Dokdonella immobilis]